MDTSSSSPLLCVNVTVIEDGQEVVSWDVPYIMGMNMIDVYRNGVLQQCGVFTEETTTSIKFPAGYLKKDDIVTIKYKFSEFNFGDLKVVPDTRALIELPNPYFNQIVIVADSKKFYKYGLEGWEEFVIPYAATNIGMMFEYEKQVIEVGQEIFNLIDIKYSPGTNDLIVFIDGEKVDPAMYEEVDSQTIAFYEGITQGSKIEFLVANNSPWEEENDHILEYGYAGGNIKSEALKVGEEVLRTRDFEYDGAGNIVKEIISKSDRVILKEYEYDSSSNVIKTIVTVVK